MIQWKAKMKSVWRQMQSNASYSCSQNWAKTHMFLNIFYYISLNREANPYLFAYFIWYRAWLNPTFSNAAARWNAYVRGNLQGEDNPDNSIEKVNTSIQDKSGILLDNQQLIFFGKRLEYDRTFADYNIQEESILHYILHVLYRITYVYLQNNCLARKCFYQNLHSISRYDADFCENPHLWDNCFGGRQQWF